MRVCYHCGAELPKRERVPFKELCPKCEAFLHCCKNCRLYAAEAHNHCLSVTTEHVPDVEQGNYCEEFRFREIEEPKDSSGKPKRVDEPLPRARTARERFERLFKD